MYSGAMQWVCRLVVVPPERYLRTALISLGIAALGVAEMAVLFLFVAVAFVVQVFILWGRYGDNPHRGPIGFWLGAHPFTDIFTVLYLQAGAIIILGTLRAAVFALLAAVRAVRGDRCRSA